MFMGTQAGTTGQGSLPLAGDLSENEEVPGGYLGKLRPTCSPRGGLPNPHPWGLGLGIGMDGWTGRLPCFSQEGAR